MKMTALSLIFAASLALSSAAAFGADAKDYQVTGPVLEVNDKMIAVQKGKDRWELMKDASTKMSGGDVKVGDKVTVHYTMTATSVEAKAAKAEKGAKKEEGAKTEASPKK